ERLGEDRLLALLVVAVVDLVGRGVRGLVVDSLFGVVALLLRRSLLRRRLLGGRLLGGRLLGGSIHRRLDGLGLDGFGFGLRRPGLLGRGRSHVSPFTERRARPGTFRTLVRPLSSPQPDGRRLTT